MGENLSKKAAAIHSYPFLKYEDEEMSLYNNYHNEGKAPKSNVFDIIVTIY